LFEFIGYSAERLEFLLLIILRTSGLFIIAPILGYRTLPAAVKIGLVLTISLVLNATLINTSIPPIANEWQLLGFVARELIIGFLIGFFFQMIFMGVHIAGALVGYQIGFALVALFDPNQSEETSIVGQFWFLFAALIFLSIDGHHILIKSYVDSYTVLPPGSISFSPEIATIVAKATTYVFVLALKVAAPIIVTLFLTDVALGTVAKMMPTMNVFFVGFPLKIGAGILVMALSLPIAASVLQKGMVFVDSELQQLFLALGKM
jgi:flagellar biosynthetic protein FliR